MSGEGAAPATRRPRSLGRLALLYALFAVVATVCNLGAQRLVLALYPGPFPLLAAIVVGTAAGLVVKYVLDKRWIFDDRSTGLAAHGRRFGLYTLMGLFTTLLFWAVELGFWWVWRTDAARELGAVIGLAIGYTIKYRLDRAYVFRPGGG